MLLTRHFTLRAAIVIRRTLARKKLLDVFRAKAPSSSDLEASKPPFAREAPHRLLVNSKQLTDVRSTHQRLHYEPPFVSLSSACFTMT